MNEQLTVMNHGCDAYAAVATPPGRSGVALIRLAGKDAPVVADRVFRFGQLGAKQTHPARRVQQMAGYTAALGYLVDPKTEEVIDQAVVLRYRAPHSYTGEDVVEFTVHGGGQVTRKSLQAIFSAGGRPAEAGEFTRNAFLNGKMDLAQAEAVIDLIDAETTRFAQAAVEQLKGGLSDSVHEILSVLYELMSALEMSIEYPDHEDSRLEIDSMRELLVGAITLLEQLKLGYRQGAILRDGLHVVLTGLPNVGKSSFLNRLSGQDRSIVTDLPGTTRDTIELDIELDGIPVHLIDTAGLRDSTDPIERIGIERAQQSMAKADLLIWMLAPPFENSEKYDYWFSKLPKDKPLLVLANKDDLPSFPDFLDQIKQWLDGDRKLTELQHSVWKTYRQDHGDNVDFEPIAVSAKDGSGFDTVIDLIRSMYRSYGAASRDQVILTSARHYDAVSKALDLLRQIHTDLDFLPQDVLAQALSGATEQLALIVGERVSDEVITQIFSRFCVGK